MLHLSQNCKMRNVHTTLLRAFQRHQTHNKKELSLKLPCLCALVWPCVSSSILKRSCKVSRMQKKWRHRKAKSKTQGKPPLKTNLHERTSLVPSFSFFSVYSCQADLIVLSPVLPKLGPSTPQSGHFMDKSNIYGLIHLCNPKKSEEAKVLNFATFTWVASLVYDIYIPLKVTKYGGSQPMGQLGGLILKTYNLFFEICCNAFQSMTCEETIGEVHSFLYNSILRILSMGTTRMIFGNVHKFGSMLCDHSYRECVVIRAT